MKIKCLDSLQKEYWFEASEYIERHAVYGLLIKYSEILLVKDSWGHKWGLPGGGIDEGETEIKALTREFQEETGAQIKGELTKVFSDISYFLGHNEPKPWKTIRSFFLIEDSIGDLKKLGNGIDVVEVKYFPTDELTMIELQSNTRETLEKLLQN